MRRTHLENHDNAQGHHQRNHWKKPGAVERVESDEQHRSYPDKLTVVSNGTRTTIETPIH